MSEIREMIQELCPDGVEFKKLGEIGRFIRGNGLQKKDFTEDGFPCIHYGQIYTKYGLSTTETISRCDPELAEKLIKAKTGDLVIACTSENVEDVCKAVVWLGDGEIATGGHSCVFTHNQDPKYVAYFFQSEQFFIQKKKYAKGVKVIDIRAADLEKIEIPVPPMAVQRKIVEILDNFSNLTAELEAELEERKRQYEYYRNLLLTFNPVANGAVTGGEHQIMDATENRGGQADATWLRMSDIGAFYGGLSGKSKKDFGNGNAKYITYMNVYSNISVNMDLVDTVSVSTDEKQNAIQFGDILFTGSSETPDECGMSSVVTEFIEEPTYLNSFCFGFRPYNIKSFNVHFLKHLFRSQTLRKQIIRTASGVTRFNVSKKKMLNVSVPIPSIEKQNYIADILDRFETLTTDLQSGIPAEIAARRQQYEYYREQLLTFKRKAA